MERVRREVGVKRGTKILAFKSMPVLGESSETLHQGRKVPSPFIQPIATLRKWSKPDSALSEGTMEALIAALFYCGLRWSPANAQAQLKGKIGSADIVLKPTLADRSRWVFIEVKVPSYDLRTNASINKAVRQATRYAIEWGAHRCVITNGRIWWCFSVYPQQKKYGPYLTVSLVRFDIGRDRQLTHAILRRCTKARITALWDFLEDRFRTRDQSQLLPGANQGPFAPPAEEKWQDTILRSLQNQNRAVFLRTVFKPWRRVKTRIKK